MKKIFLIFILLSPFWAISQNQIGLGIIYGGNIGFMVGPPKGWVMDNQSGSQDGLPCVFYLENYNWSNSPVIMYGRVEPKTTIKSFVEFATKEYEKDDSKFRSILYKERKVQSKFDCQEYDNYIGVNNSYERVAYIQTGISVCYIVFSSRTKENFDSYAKCVDEILEKFTFVGEVKTDK